MLFISSEGSAFIGGFEGTSLVAYPDPVTKGDPWTIGKGHTAGVKPGDTLPDLAAVDAIFAADLAMWCPAVWNLVRNAKVTTQHQFDAMVSLAYNIGVAAFSGSSVCRYHNAGNTAMAAKSFLLWNNGMVNGSLQPVQGLTNRRRAEMATYVTPEFMPHPQPTPPPQHLTTLPVPLAALNDQTRTEAYDPTQDGPLTPTQAYADIPSPAPVELPPAPAVAPKGYAVTDTGNVIREDVSESVIVKASKVGQKMTVVAGITSMFSAFLATMREAFASLFADIDPLWAIGIALVSVAAAIGAWVYFSRVKTKRIEMHAQGIA